jgi:hypothetical protein
MPYCLSAASYIKIGVEHHLSGLGRDEKPHVFLLGPRGATEGFLAEVVYDNLEAG